MMPSQQPQLQRLWWVPGDGIDREVICRDIQRYLGNDATVKPGVGSGEYAGTTGFWLTAYRNLTTAMVMDIRKDSERWQKEKNQTGRTDYGRSEVHHSTGSSARYTDRRGGTPPTAEPVYGGAPPRYAPDHMQVDPVQSGRTYPPEPRYPQDPRYQPDARGYPPDHRNYPQDPRAAYPNDPSAYTGGAAPRAPPVSSPYAQDPRYSVASPTAGDAPAGYMRQGNHYVPIPGYDPSGASGRGDPRYPQNPYGQPGPPPGRERDSMGGYGGQSEYDQSRYSYPSPAATVSSVVRDREPVAPPNTSGYPPVQYDSYGRPVHSNVGQVPGTNVPPGYRGRPGTAPAPVRQPDRTNRR